MVHGFANIRHCICHVQYGKYKGQQAMSGIGGALRDRPESGSSLESRLDLSSTASDEGA